MNNRDLILTSRQSSLLVAGSLFILFFVFMLGYFLGTKHATDEFVAQLNQEVFADQILASVHTLDQQVSQISSIEHESQTVQNTQEIGETLENSTLDTLSVATTNSQSTPLPPHYAAELIGFGTEKAAQQFIHRVAQRDNILLELRARSYMRHGKKSHWYQVVTPRYETREELNSVIALITKKEKLHNINDVSC